MPVIIEPLGDHALTVTLGEIIDEKINNKVLALFHYLQQKNIEEVKDYIPAYASLTVVYDIALIKKYHSLSSFEYMRNVIEDALRNFNDNTQEETTPIHIPVCYDVSVGIDLEEMAVQKNITIEEIVELHTAAAYRVYMIGFLPGFAYMGKVNTRIATPRKAVPRKNVNAGSVGIADFQTGIYPFNSPGGWNIIGQTPLQIFNTTYTEPCVLKPGDIVKFEPISLEEFQDLKS